MTAANDSLKPYKISFQGGSGGFATRHLALNFFPFGEKLVVYRKMLGYGQHRPRINGGLTEG